MSLLVSLFNLSESKRKHVGHTSFKVPTKKVRSSEQPNHHVQQVNIDNQALLDTYRIKLFIYTAIKPCSSSMYFHILH